MIHATRTQKVARATWGSIMTARVWVTFVALLGFYFDDMLDKQHNASHRRTRSGPAPGSYRRNRAARRAPSAGTHKRPGGASDQRDLCGVSARPSSSTQSSSVRRLLGRTLLRSGPGFIGVRMPARQGAQHRASSQMNAGRAKRVAGSTEADPDSRRCRTRAPFDSERRYTGRSGRV